MKRFISILTIGVMLFALLPVSLFGAAAYNSDFAGGSGTAQDPYLIATPRQLDRIRNYMDCHFKLICDIEFTDADFQEGGYFYNDGLGWVPFGLINEGQNDDYAYEGNWEDGEHFTGSLDGNDYAIRGLSSGGFWSVGAAGLFAINDGVIQNLSLDEGVIHTAFGDAGAFAISNNGTIQNCVNRNEVSVEGPTAGIAVYNYGLIESCSNYGHVWGDGRIGEAGGMTVINEGDIKDCINYVEMVAGYSCASIAISNRGVVIGCANFGDISGASSGGICDENSGIIENCYNTGAVSGGSRYGVFIGGIAGGSSGIIRNCYNNGKVEGYSYRFYEDYGTECSAGGIAGCNTGMVENCYNTAAVSATGEDFLTYAGGVVGINEGTIKSCNNKGEVVAKRNSELYYIYSFAGGIVGSSMNEIIDCYNLGDVSADSYAGGIVGESYDRIDRCYNAGKIFGANICLGGIAGGFSGEIENCYNIGKIIGGEDVANSAGGIVGDLWRGEILTSYNTGEILMAYGVGGIAGMGGMEGKVANSYYLDNVWPGVDDPSGEGDYETTRCTLSQMKSQSTFVGFNFDTIWAIREGESTPYFEKDHTHAFKYECDTVCQGCGFVRQAEHSFSEYVYNRDATDKKDGTQTRTCEYCQTQETITAPGTKTPNPFKDVKSNAYYFKAVLWAVREGITAGTTATTFSPNMACDRSQVVTFLWRAAGSPEPQNKTNPFKDVKKTDYYYKAVLWAVEQGITSGTAANTFSPKMVCDRAQIVTFLWRAAGNPYPETDTNPFKDVSYGSYYYSAVLWAVENGITSGTSAKTFSPNMACDRAQIVTFLQRS
jgi:hypothetical protein